MKQPLIILGAGGLAGEIYSWIDHGRYELLGFYDPLWSKGAFAGLPVFPVLDGLRFTDFVIASDSPSERFRLFELAVANGLAPAMPIVHPTVCIGAESTLSRGIVLGPRVVITYKASIDRNVYVRPGALIGYGCTVEDHCVIGSGAMLLGENRLGESAFIGAGAVVRVAKSIGVAAVVQMGAVVLKDVADRATIQGPMPRPLECV